MNIESIKYSFCKYINRHIGAILIYHSVIDIPLKFNLWTHMQVSLFEEHMRLLSKEANVVSLNEMADGIIKGKLPPNAVAVTFDDGFRNNFTRAYPVLKRYNIPATIFLSTAYIGTDLLFWPEKLSYLLINTNHRMIDNKLLGRFTIDDPDNMKQSYASICNKLKEYDNDRIEKFIAELKAELEVEFVIDDPLYQEWLPLGWNEVTVMEQEGLITFGGHTDRHSILSKHSDDEVLSEIRRCRLSLAANLKNAPYHWAHPNGQPGDFSDRHEAMLLQEGFNFIYPSIPHYVHRNTPLNRIGRFGVGSNFQIEEMRDLITKRYYLARLNGIEKIKHIAKSLIGRQ
jgi:peptidoglycan/xylan/chitin deacetylase (PgdA/CDA1 family)